MKPKALANVQVKIRPCSIDALEALRRRFLSSRCPPQLKLVVPFVIPGRGTSSRALPKMWTLELVDWKTCGLIFTPAWRQPSRRPGLHACGLVVLLNDLSAYIALPPFRLTLKSMCPVGRTQGNATLKYDSMLLSNTGDWLPPGQDQHFPNLDALMMGASLDLLKIEEARLTVRGMGDTIPLLPPATVQAAFNVLPEEYWPFPRPPPPVEDP